MKQLRSLDWEAMAGITAATLALVLHLLHIAEEGVLLTVTLVLLALLLLRDLRRENRDEEESVTLTRIDATLSRLDAGLNSSDIQLIGPKQLRTESERFSRDAYGEMTWFNVCLSMFESQNLFDVLLGSALENPRVTSIRFVLRPDERERWEQAILARARSLAGAHKLQKPRWVPLEENISFIMANTPDGEPEAHLSFWGEPFMARSRGRDIPRYVLYVRKSSPSIGGLEELERSYRGLP